MRDNKNTQLTCNKVVNKNNRLREFLAMNSCELVNL